MPEAATPEQRATLESLTAAERTAAIAFRKQGKSLQETIRLVKVGQQGTAAAAGAVADDETREPTTAEKVASGAQGAADSLSFGMAPKVVGVNRALANAIPGIVPEGARKAAAGVGMAMASPAVMPLALLGDLGVLGDYAKGRDEQQAATDAASSGKLASTYGGGHLAGDVANMALAGVGGAVDTAAQVQAGGVKSLVPTLEQALGRGAASSVKAGAYRAGQAVKNLSPMKVAGDIAEGGFTRGLSKSAKGVLESLFKTEAMGSTADAAQIARLGKVPPPPAPLEVTDADVLEAGLLDEGPALELARPLPPRAAAKPTPAGGHPIKFTQPVEEAPASAYDAALERVPTEEASAQAPASLAPDVAAANAKIDPELANDVVEGGMSIRAAGGATRSAARAANAPKGQVQIKDSILQLVKNEPGLAKNMSAKAAQIAKRLGITPADAKMAINAIAWGR